MYPVGLLAYNRPEHLKQTLEYLQKNILSDKTDLFIFLDKNDPNAPETKEISDYLVSLKKNHTFKSLSVQKAPEHLGIHKSTIKAGNFLSERYEGFILLEDDIPTHPQFLSFMNESLDFYKDNPDVLVVMGYSHEAVFNKVLKKHPYDTVLSYSFFNFGSGFLKHQWESIDWSMKDFSIHHKKLSFKLKSFVYSWGTSFLFKHEYNDSEKKQLWDVRLMYHMVSENKYCAWPRYSYSGNLGFDGSGYHKMRLPKEIFEFKTHTKELSRPRASSFNPNLRMHFRIMFYLLLRIIKYFVKNCLLKVCRFLRSK